MNGEKESYFESYSDVSVHSLLLQDKPRLEAYKESIFSCNDFWKDKVVLDVGAGTGILSIYCAKAGAKKVYAVEASDITSVTEKIIKENHLSNTIEVLNDRVENISLPCKVDVIVSEWMGFYLLHESMLDSVIFARDKFLKKDGKIFPDYCHLYAVPCSLPSYNGYWDDVTGVKMKSFALAIRKCSQHSPTITTVASTSLLAESTTPIISYNMYEVCTKDLQMINVKLFTIANREGSYEGLCIWFDVTFSQSKSKFSTSPFSPETHWKQTVLVFPTPLSLVVGEPVAGSLVFRKDQSNTRQYTIEFDMLDAEKVQHPHPCDCYFTKCAVIKAFLAQYEKSDDYDNKNGDPDAEDLSAAESKESVPI